jgi:hypothetical protein
MTASSCRALVSHHQFRLLTKGKHTNFVKKIRRTPPLPSVLSSEKYHLQGADFFFFKAFPSLSQRRQRGKSRSLTSGSHSISLFEFRRKKHKEKKMLSLKYAFVFI